MKLALRLGRTLAELGETMSAEEFGLWAALYTSDPFDELRADYQTGLVCATVANWSGRILREGAQPMSPLDFMPFRERPAAEPEVESDPIAHFRSLI